jgi:MFS family permease
MPVAARALGGVSSYGLAFGAYFATSLLGVVAAGGWNDARGPRAPVLTGLAVFAVGLLVAGAAPTYAVLLVGRAVTGFGGGLLNVSLYVVVADVYPADLQPRVFGAISTAWVLPSIVGPAVAGWLATHWTWRAVFLVVLPLACALVPVLSPRLRGTAPSAGRQERPGVVRARLVRGLLLAAGALVVQGGVDAGGAAGTAGAVVGAVLVAAALPALVPAGALRLRRGLPSLVVVRTLFTGTFAGTEIFIPLMLVAHRGVTAALAGAALTLGAIGWTLGSWLQGSGRVRADRATLLAAGGITLGTGVLLLAGTPLGSLPAWLVAPAWIVAASGMGCGMSSMSVLTLWLSPAGEEGRSSSALGIGDALGSLLGVALAGALFSAVGGGSAAKAAPYVLVWVVLGVAGLSSAVLAVRVRTPGDAPSSTARAATDLIQP